jgi:hypothetical protein
MQLMVEAAVHHDSLTRGVQLQMTNAGAAAESKAGPALESSTSTPKHWKNSRYVARYTASSPPQYCHHHICMNSQGINCMITEVKGHCINSYVRCTVCTQIRLQKVKVHSTSWSPAPLPSSSPPKCPPLNTLNLSPTPASTPSSPLSPPQPQSGRS